MTDKQREYWAIETPDGVLVEDVLVSSERRAWTHYYHFSPSVSSLRLDDWMIKRISEGYKAVKLVRASDE